MTAYDDCNMTDGGRAIGFSYGWLTAIACCCLAAQPLKAADAVSTAELPEARVQPHRPALEQRITLMSVELGLDERQQAELRKILIRQRLQIMQLWSDNSVPAASRVGATRVLSEQSADQIRALLNEEQKAKYNRPRKPRDSASDANARSVEDWMSAAGRN